MYELKIKRPGSLLGVILQLDISEADLAAVRTVLRIHDHSDESPCVCAFQFPASPWSLAGLWADARRRAELAENRREAEPEPLRFTPEGTFDDPTYRRSAFRQPGEIVNGLYRVVGPTRPTVRPGTEIDHEMMVAGDTID